ncbi:hypothetical protein LEP1GSC021_2710 [Leptospira noguchii str. 1993005606]|uniref:Uncharacterized protein n=1 Tax=Leptospira noguchii str. 2007001578 TaxID=1049974 RepID=A0ABN0J0R4_9LEPT|nr:hypothetical protein LEP1GSC035_2288 [Leptospira noguchii str. 2007001578]EPE83655.1 hypothetical protein LEP1GSC021_2710 [Leptospira noguchii str. 1993005606]
MSYYVIYQLLSYSTGVRIAIVPIFFSKILILTTVKNIVNFQNPCFKNWICIKIYNVLFYTTAISANLSKLLDLLKNSIVQIYKAVSIKRFHKTKTDGGLIFNNSILNLNSRLIFLR